MTEAQGDTIIELLSDLYFAGATGLVLLAMLLGATLFRLIRLAANERDIFGWLVVGLALGGGVANAQEPYGTYEHNSVCREARVEQWGNNQGFGTSNPKYVWYRVSWQDLGGGNGGSNWFVAERGDDRETYKVSGNGSFTQSAALTAEQPKALCAALTAAAEANGERGWALAILCQSHMGGSGADNGSSLPANAGLTCSQCVSGTCGQPDPPAEWAFPVGQCSTVSYGDGTIEMVRRGTLGTETYDLALSIDAGCCVTAVIYDTAGQVVDFGGDECDAFDALAEQFGCLTCQNDPVSSRAWDLLHRAACGTLTADEQQWVNVLIASNSPTVGEIAAGSEAADCGESDLDGDGIPDEIDDDDDGDGIDDATDPCPQDPTNTCNDDDDGDGIPDGNDPCPCDPDPAATADNCAVQCSGDDNDGDGIDDAHDPCPCDPENQVDGEGDCVIPCGRTNEPPDQDPDCSCAIDWESLLATLSPELARLQMDLSAAEAAGKLAQWATIPIPDPRPGHDTIDFSFSTGAGFTLPDGSLPFWAGSIQLVKVLMRNIVLVYFAMLFVQGCYKLHSV